MTFSKEELNWLIKLVKEQLDGNKFDLVDQSASYRRIRERGGMVTEEHSEYAMDHLTRIKIRVEFWGGLLKKLEKYKNK